MGQRQRQQDSEVTGSINHVGISSSTEDSDKIERSASGPRERRHDPSRFDGNSSSSHGRDADDAYGRHDAEQRRKGDRRPRRLGDSGGSVVDEASEADGHGHSHGKGRKKSDRMVGANANHLLNFQFQPVSVAQSHGQHHHVAGSRRNNGSSKGRKGGRGWGEGASRKPMSRDQFLQVKSEPMPPGLRVMYDYCTLRVVYEYCTKCIRMFNLLVGQMLLLLLSYLD